MQTKEKEKKHVLDIVQRVFNSVKVWSVLNGQQKTCVVRFKEYVWEKG